MRGLLLLAALCFATIGVAEDRRCTDPDETLLYCPRPDAPPVIELKRGFVNVAYDVIKDGTVGNARVIDSEGDPRWREAALEAILRWQYVPSAQAVSKTLRFRFGFGGQIEPPASGSDAPGTGRPAEARGALATTLDRILVEESLAGVAWMIVEAAGKVSTGAAGMQDAQDQRPFDSSTRFHVGSLTKTVLATAALRLATEGRVDLDKPALRYLPTLFSGEPPAGFSEVTVRHLLDHTAGLNDAQLWQIFSERAGPDDPLVAAFPDPQSQLQVRSQPGSRFSYSNTGYTLIGMIIESITGVRYETYVDEYVLVPLGMLSSTFAFTSQEGDYRDPKLAWGHVDDGSRYAAHAVFLRPAAQLTTTAIDLGRFAEFLMGDGTIDGRVFIDSALMRSRGKPFATEAAIAGLDAGYSLGLGRRDRHGVVGYCHGGNTVGFVAMLCIFPSEQKAFAYSTNTDSESADYGRLSEALIDALGMTPAESPPTSSANADIVDWHGRYVLSPNRFRTFEYLDTVFGAVSLAGGPGELTLATLQREDRQLRPIGGRLFSANDRSTTSHVLARGSSGEYLLSDGFQTLRKVPTLYLLGHWGSLALGLAGIAWIVIAGLVALFRSPARLRYHAVLPAFAGSVALLIPVPFFFSQSFMALGDLTLASGLLACFTLTLPVGMLFTIRKARLEWRQSVAAAVHGVAAILVLQWCVVLAVNGLLPLRLWA